MPLPVMFLLPDTLLCRNILHDATMANPTMKALKRRRASQLEEDRAVPLANIPVAQYVRMSTEDQQYSIAHQKGKLQEYAARHGFNICRTYADAGRSGVVIKRRKGLSDLLGDVISGGADFKAVLVYDVSRWGRFQNPDEAAHYEFLCSTAGIPIHYCAEQFANDGSLPSSIMKALKRTMAGEYSRELGVKVFDGQKRVVQLGFRVGGPELYGLRRMVISADGRRKHLLNRGEAKSIVTDRVILVPGSTTKVARVQQMFHMTVFEKKSARQIADKMNQQKVRSLTGLPWTKNTVLRILKNPEYAGCAVWGRTTRRLHGEQTTLPRTQWTITSGAFVPIVDEALFEQAQGALEKRRSKPLRKSDKEIIDRLKRVLEREGKLSGRIIAKSRGLFAPRAYYRRFGSYLKVYQLAGYTPPPKVVQMYMSRRRNWELRQSVLRNLTRLFPDNISIIKLSGRGRRHVAESDKQLQVSVYLCPRFLTKSGEPRWKLNISTEERDNVALLCLLDAKAEQVFSYHLISPIGHTAWSEKHLRDGDSWLGPGSKLEGLSQFYEKLKTTSNRSPSGDISTS
jgi:DNA invertase Pin-like site-specific DNA recombinase